MPFGLGRLPGPLHWLADVATTIAGPLLGRSTWTYPGRIHLELLCEPAPTTEIETALQVIPGVRWARVNEPAGRVIVAIGDPAPDTRALLAALDEAERKAEHAPKEPAHAATPEEPPPGLVLAADLGGMAATVLEWVLRRTPLPAEAAGLVGLIDTMPRLRQAVGRAAHTDILKAWLPVMGAAAQGLAPGVTGLIADTAQRVVQVRESRALAAAWRAAEERLTGTPERAASGLRPAVRPVPLPPGPAERYADQLMTGAPLGGVVGALLTSAPRRGLQTAMIFTPKPAMAGRDTFAAELGAVLARRGIVIIDRRALRRLDRIDTVAVSERTLRGSPYGEVIEAAAARAGLRFVTIAEPGTAEVHGLQREGGGVLLVSSDGPALAAADCGLGVPDGDGPPPWGAALLLPGGPAPAVHLIAAVEVARRVSEDGVRLARAGTAVAAMLTLTGHESRSARQALSVIGAASCLSIGQGAWRAWRAVRDPIREPAKRVPWHSMPVEDVLAELGAHPEGLPDVPRERRPRPAAERQSLAGGVVAELANPFTPVLASGAAGSAAIGSFVDAGLILAVMGMSALIGGAQRTATARTLAGLARHMRVPAMVLRGGRVRHADARDLVPGDIVLLSAGQVVPADCRIIEADGLEADESALTGESLPVAKDPAPLRAREVAERRSMLYEGTSIAAGTAKVVVVAVDEDTETGRAMAAAGDKPQVSGVADRLAQITRATTPIALAAAATIVLSGLARGRPLRDSLGEGVNLAVAAVPEGLPLLVSAAQLAATRRLSAHGVHVRDPRIIEALGRVEVLCFDKTGTLTVGEIRLTRVADARRERPLDDLDADLARVLAAGVRATPQRGHDGEHSHLTDAAVAEGAEQVKVTRRTGSRGWQEVAALPFEPSRGFHATVGRVGGGHLLSVKGAPETVLPRCTLIRLGGEDRPLTAAERRRLDKRVHALAESGHRVLAVAERRLPASWRAAPEPSDDDVGELVFVGLLGLADVVRRAASPALARLRAAGVQIVMLTGDHPGTAGAVAAGLLPGEREPHVLTGAELEEMDDEELRRRLPGADVVARCTPAQKVKVVRCFQKLGRTIAMTGDGANDAAGIRLADVGIALGGTGTPAARAAADLVVADDRLETIVHALVEGRALWASVRSALAILVGGNLGEIAFTLLGSLLSGSSPLSARQLLLVNLLTDLAPSLAIALRAPSTGTAAGLLQEGPESSLGRALNRDIVRRAVITTAAAGIAWTVARFTGTRARARTVGLLALVGAQLAQTLQAGGRDRAVLLSALGSAAVLAVVVQTPVLSHFFGSAPVGPVGWAIAVGAVAAVLALDATGLLRTS
ncbi:HAD-IC family P-type ATPase [Spongiactinospora sp. 9N601]|uniref:HAD-IC family P-type ATPase n=1 Tax=Spongiactinospora sp. 9N601 TaxID=3375149 RepID=UPI0037A00EA7